MVDSINTLIPPGSSASQPLQRVSTEQVPAVAEPALSRAEAARYSDGATELYAGMRRDAVPGNEPINLETVQRIKELIAAGRYPVDLSRIAERMVELDLSPAPPQAEIARDA